LLHPWPEKVEDRQVYINMSWAKGRSIHKRLETKEKANYACQSCGATGVTLYVHHPNRLVKAKQAKKGVGPVAKSGMEQQTKLLCRACHLAHHHNNARQ
jgi:predicted methyltransferase